MIEITSKTGRSSGVYIAKWVGTDYFYIGQSVNLYKRKLSHLRCLKKGLHQNKKINYVSKKYGIPVFYILELCEIKYLNVIEQKYLDKYFDNCNKCLNVVSTAGSCRGYKHKPRSKEYREKLSKSLKGKIVSEDTRRKLSEANKGKKISEKQKQALIKSRKGIPLTDKHKENISKSLTGRVLSKTHRENIGKTKIGNTYNRGRKASEEEKIKNSEARKKNLKNLKNFADLNISRRKPVVQKDFNGKIIKIFKSITEASLFGFDRSSINLCIKGKHTQHKGFKWEYYNDKKNEQ